jgi:hypothetical protein
VLHSAATASGFERVVVSAMWPTIPIARRKSKAFSTAGWPNFFRTTTP